MARGRRRRNRQRAKGRPPQPHTPQRQRCAAAHASDERLTTTSASNGRRHGNSILVGRRNAARRALEGSGDGRGGDAGKAPRPHRTARLTDGRSRGGRNNECRRGAERTGRNDATHTAWWVRLEAGAGDSRTAGEADRPAGRRHASAATEGNTGRSGRPDRRQAETARRRAKHGKPETSRLTSATAPSRQVPRGAGQSTRPRRRSHEPASVAASLTREARTHTATGALRRRRRQGRGAGPASRRDGDSAPEPGQQGRSTEHWGRRTGAPAARHGTRRRAPQRAAAGPLARPPQGRRRAAPARRTGRPTLTTRPNKPAETPPPHRPAPRAGTPQSTPPNHRPRPRGIRCRAGNSSYAAQNVAPTGATRQTRGSSVLVRLRVVARRLRRIFGPVAAPRVRHVAVAARATAHRRTA